MKAAAVLKRGDFSAETLRQCAMIPDIYSDLPEFEELISCKRRTPAELLNRYNLAQVQGLLFYATRITLTVKDAPAAELRKLLKAIKFFRLLAHFSSNGKNSLTAEISGPFEIFGPTAKYSMQLANFFPAAVNLPNWKMTAGIKIKGRELTLKLSHKNQLVSHYRNLGGYIPPEVKTFHDLFNEKQDSWQIVGDTPFLDAGNQELVFPDLSIRSADSGNIWHIELFHRWHAALLKKRIALLNADPSLPLLLGIDRALVKDEAEFGGLFENCPHIREKCWLFRDFPGISSTLNVLKKAEKSLQRGK